MKYFDWSKEKNELLKIKRGVSFEDVLISLEVDGLIKITNHPNQKKYSGQKIFILVINNYVYMVPFVEDKEKVFLKTIFPSRKATKKYLFNN